MKFFLIIILSILFQSNFSQDYIDYFEDGTIKVKGFYKKGKAQGDFITYDSIGDTLSIIFYKNGKAHGPFIQFFTGKNLRSKYIRSRLDNYSDWREEKMKMEGTYYKGKINGEFTIYYKNGIKKEIGFYKRGIKHGKFIEYHDNGKMRQTKYYNQNKLHGDWHYYYNTGKIREFRDYNFGKIITSNIYEHFDNGNIEHSDSFIHDENQKSIYNKKPHGIWLSYYENGNMRTNSYYDNGKPDKEWKSFYENGKVKSIMIYKDKKYISYTKYDENGAILN